MDCVHRVSLKKRGRFLLLAVLPRGPDHLDAVDTF